MVTFKCDRCITLQCKHCGKNTSVGRTAERHFVCSKCGYVNDTFRCAWDAVLGGFALMPMIAFATTVLWCAISAYFAVQIALRWNWPASLGAEEYATITALGFAIICDSAFCIVAIILAVLFLKKNAFSVKCAALFYKIRGVYNIIVLMIALIVADILYDASSAVNIKGFVMSIFWCFLWAWLFKRIQKQLPVIETD